jgi:hypothetical protein
MIPTQESSAHGAVRTAAGNKTFTTPLGFGAALRASGRQRITFFTATVAHCPVLGGCVDDCYDCYFVLALESVVPSTAATVLFVVSCLLASLTANDDDGVGLKIGKKPGEWPIWS